MLRAVAHTPLSSLISNSSIASGSAVALTTATPANITSKSITPGTWLVWGTIDFALAAATVTLEQGGLNNTSATLPTQQAPLTEGLSTRVPNNAATVTQTDQIDIRPTVITVASTVTLFLVAQATFSAGAVSAYGTLFAMQLNAP